MWRKVWDAIAKAAEEMALALAEHERLKAMHPYCFNNLWD